MQHYLKFSCSLVLIGLLGTSCQKEALMVPPQPVSAASTSGGPHPPRPSKPSSPPKSPESSDFKKKQCIGTRNPLPPGDLADFKVIPPNEKPSRYKSTAPSEIPVSDKEVYSRGRYRFPSPSRDGSNFHHLAAGNTQRSRSGSNASTRSNASNASTRSNASNASTRSNASNRSDLIFFFEKGTTESQTPK